MHLFAAVLLGSTLTGQVLLNGASPEPRLDKPEIDNDACGNGLIADRATIVTGQGGLPYVVITLQPMGKNLKMKSRVPDEIEIEQAACEFVPFVAVARPDSTVRVTNGDPTLHNVHVRKDGKTVRNVGQPPGGRAVELSLKSTGPIRIHCDIHYWMKGWIYVTKEPLATVTSNEGTFRFDDVPEGKYMLTAWHPAHGKTRQTIEVTSDKETTLEVKLPQFARE